MTILRPRYATAKCQYAVHRTAPRHIALTIESHEPVHNDMASLLTPRQLTRLS